VRRALVLNAALGWGAYQAGAIRHLVVERGLRFDLCAGTGIGAMNAALVACGAVGALEEFWSHARLRSLLRPNLRHPWRDGPCSGAPQRRFIAGHVHEDALRERRVELWVSTFDVQRGLEEVLVYPGCELPLTDALMAAAATPGLLPPVVHRGRQLAEGTMISGFLLPSVVRADVEEVVAVGAAIRPGRAPARRYRTWRAVLQRALTMNQAHDVLDGLRDADTVAAAAAAFRRLEAELPGRAAAAVGDPATSDAVRDALDQVYRSSRFPLRRAAGPVVHAITPSIDLDYPMWRFRGADLAWARALGHRDARTALADHPLGEAR
jgi:NTE family protein